MLANVCFAQISSGEKQEETSLEQMRSSLLKALDSDEANNGDPKAQRLMRQILEDGFTDKNEQEMRKLIIQPQLTEDEMHRQQVLLLGWCLTNFEQPDRIAAIAPDKSQSFRLAIRHQALLGSALFVIPLATSHDWPRSYAKLLSDAMGTLSRAAHEAASSLAIANEQDFGQVCRDITAASSIWITLSAHMSGAEVMPVFMRYSASLPYGYPYLHEVIYDIILAHQDKAVPLALWYWKNRWSFSTNGVRINEYLREHLQAGVYEAMLQQKLDDTAKMMDILASSQRGAEHGESAP